MENGVNQLPGGHPTHWAMATSYGEQVAWTLDFAFCKYSGDLPKPSTILHTSCKHIGR